MTETKTEVRKPFEKDFTMTQPFGVFFWMDGRKLKHQGVDWALYNGTPVLSCFNGVVSRVEKYRTGGYGRSIYLRSLDGKFEALYAHLSSAFVEVGEKISRGQVIGHSGNTGFCRGVNGYHLHFGLKLYNEYVDPLKYVGVELPQNALIKSDEYVIERGDTLFNIAGKFFVGGDLWPEIYKLNEKVIGSDPNLIKPGQVLKIPVANKK